MIKMRDLKLKIRSNRKTKTSSASFVTRHSLG